MSEVRKGPQSSFRQKAGAAALFGAYLTGSGLAANAIVDRLHGNPQSPNALASQVRKAETSLYLKERKIQYFKADFAINPDDTKVGLRTSPKAIDAKNGEADNSINWENVVAVNGEPINGPFKLKNPPVVDGDDPTKGQTGVDYTKWFEVYVTTQGIDGSTSDTQAYMSYSPDTTDTGGVTLLGTHIEVGKTRLTQAYGNNTYKTVAGNVLTVGGVSPLQGST